MLLHGGHQVVGFQGQAARIQGEDFDGQARLDDEVGQHHVFGPQAVGEGGRGEVPGDLGQQGLGGFRLGRSGGPQLVGDAELGGNDAHAALRRKRGWGWSTAAW